VSMPLDQAVVHDSGSISNRKLWAIPPGKREGWPGRKKAKIMPLIQVLEVLVVVGILLWLVNRFIPMQGTIKSILNGVVVIAVVLWILNIFGLFHSFAKIHVGS
jgi:hypothetical protein